MPTAIGAELWWQQNSTLFLLLLCKSIASFKELQWKHQTFFKGINQNKTDIWSLSCWGFFSRDYSKHVLKQKHFTLKEESNYSRYFRWSFLCVCESQRFNWRETFVCCYSITETTLVQWRCWKKIYTIITLYHLFVQAFVGENYIHLNSSQRLNLQFKFAIWTLYSKQHSTISEPCCVAWG